MEIKVRDKKIMFATALKIPINVLVDMDKNEVLIINYKGSCRKIKIAVDESGELVIVRDFNLLKSKQEIKKELNRSY